MRLLQQGTDVLVVTAGITTEEAIRARAAFHKVGLSIAHLHLHTIKPFNAAALLDILSPVRYGVITLEHHVTEGGIGSLVAETIADSGIGKRLIRLGLKDTFAHGGSRPYLMRHYNLDAWALVQGIAELVGEDLGIGQEDLASARLEDVHSLLKAEAL